MRGLSPAHCNFGAGGGDTEFKVSGVFNMPLHSILEGYWQIKALAGEPLYVAIFASRDVRQPV